MADITRLSRFLNGVERGIDLQTNTPVVLSIKIGGVSNTELTKTILDKLVNLQNGSDFSDGTNSHTHDGRYFTETELGSASGTSGSDRIGDDDTYDNFTPSAATVKGALEGIDDALAEVTSDFADNEFRISDDGDPSKKIAFEAAAITAATVRTITMPDSNVDLGKVATAIQRDGSVAFTSNQPMGGFKLTGLSAGSSAGDSVRYEQAILASGANPFGAAQSMGGFKLTNLADPTTGTDAVNVNYLSARLNGLKPKESVRVASTANIDLSVAADPNPIDGVTLDADDRLLLKNQTAPEENGIYVAVDPEDPTTWVRSADFDSLSPIDEVNGAWVAVREGTASAGKIYVQYGTVAVIDTDPINFEYFNPIASLIGGDMITFSGSTFSVDLATVSGLESSNPGNAAGQLRVKLEASNPSLQINGSNELGAKLDAAGAITSGASGLKVGVDNSSIEISSNALRIKDLGVSTAKIAADAVTGAKIRLDNNQYMRARNFANSGDINMWKINASDELEAGVEVNASIFFDNTTSGMTADTVSEAIDELDGRVDSLEAIVYPGAVAEEFTAGEDLTGVTAIRAFRLTRAADPGFGAGKIVRADNDATSLDNFHCIGLAFVDEEVEDDPLILYKLGGISSGVSHGLTVGEPIYLGASGALTNTPPSAANTAVVIVGYALTANAIEVRIQIIGVN